jgi:predicted transcriptional regulator
MDRNDGDPRAGEKPANELREAALAYDASPPPVLRVVRGTGRSEPAAEKGGGKMKTSVYLEPADVRRLSWLAEVEARPQAEVIRDAIRGYRPRAADRSFALFDSVPTAAVNRDDLTQEAIDALMEGFGEDGAHG